MNNAKIIEKIEKQCESLQKKIDGLSGNYLTNTPKRQNEQRNRDNMKEKHRQKLEFLTYLKNEAVCRDLTQFETALITSTFYDVIIGILRSRQYQIEHSKLFTEMLQFDNFHEDYRKMLIKAGIDNTEKLHETLTQLEEMERKFVTPANPQDNRLRDLLFKARLNQRGDIQFTPDLLAERLVSLAEITQDSKVLEPEAAIASIADKIKEITPNVDCIEIVPDFREILELKGHNIVAHDLFEYGQMPIYDAVIMNPPFSKEVEHIKYAFGFVKPGGCLVAVCSKRFTFIQNRGYPEFNEWLEQNELYRENAVGKFEMTGVDATVIKIRKSADELAA